MGQPAPHHAGEIAEVAGADGEVVAVLGQIGEAVQHLDQTTQQNAALVEELTAAARSLQDQTAAQVQALTVFRLAGAAHPEPQRLSPEPAAPQPLPALRAPSHRPALAA